MAVTFDVTTDVGTVRLLIPDMDQHGDHIYEDNEIERFLALSANSVWIAAALALEAAATQDALALKVASALDLSTDGAKHLSGLMARAARLRQDGANPPDADTAAEVAFGFAQAVENPAQAAAVDRYRRLTT